MTDAAAEGDPAGQRSAPGRGESRPGASRRRPSRSNRRHARAAAPAAAQPQPQGQRRGRRPALPRAGHRRGAPLPRVPPQHPARRRAVYPLRLQPADRQEGQAGVRAGPAHWQAGWPVNVRRGLFIAAEAVYLMARASSASFGRRPGLRRLFPVPALHGHDRLPAGHLRPHPPDAQQEGPRPTDEDLDHLLLPPPAAAGGRQRLRRRRLRADGRDVDHGVADPDLAGARGHHPGHHLVLLRVHPHPLPGGADQAARPRRAGPLPRQRREHGAGHLRPNAGRRVAQPAQRTESPLDPNSGEPATKRWSPT